MRVLGLMCALLAGSILSAQQLQRDSQIPATDQSGDTQGAQILEKAIASAGGRQAFAGITDFRGTGKFSLASGETGDQGNVIVLGVGLKKFKLTASLAAGKREWILSNGIGKVVANGETSHIGHHNVLAMEGTTVPIQKVIALVDLQQHAVQIVGVSIVEGREAYRIRITQITTSPAEKPALGRDSFATDVLIDKETLAVVGIEDTLHPNSRTHEAYRHSVTYSDYRAVNGVRVPFSITEKIEGVRTWSMQLESLDVNVGLSDSDFQLN